jgi:hypothetical protein
VAWAKRFDGEGAGRLAVRLVAVYRLQAVFAVRAALRDSPVGYCVDTRATTLSRPYKAFINDMSNHSTGVRFCGEQMVDHLVGFFGS